MGTFVGIDAAAKFDKYLQSLLYGARLLYQ